MMPIFRRIPDFYSCIPDTQARIPDSTSKNFQDIQGYSLTRGDMLSDSRRRCCVFERLTNSSVYKVYCMLNIFCYL